MLDSDELTPQARRSLGRFVADIAGGEGCSQAPPRFSGGGGQRTADGGGRRSTLPHPELARIVLEESGYTAMLQADRSAESAGRLENLAELTRAMEEYEFARRLPRACQPGHGQ